jgi:hypothetical protein
MSWMVAALAAASLGVSLATLYAVLVVLRTTRRTERAGDERLEILREQQERLGFLRDERRMLEEELEWRRSMMNAEERPLALDAPSGSDGQARSGRLSSRPSWWRRVFGG